MNREEKRLLGWIANALLHSVLVGDPCESVQNRYNRMVDPQPGDFIFESSTLHQCLRNLDDDRWDGQFVRLVRIGTEYTEIPGEESVEETVYICMNPDGTEFTWRNATIYSLPDGPKWAMVDA